MKSIKIENAKNNISGRQLKEKDTFKFSCHKNLSCFNHCCRNINMFLYPYDILRLKNALKTTSFHFIENHVDLIIRKGNYFPDALLRMNENNNMACPFLTTNGCSVYYDRPYTCRTFPLEQGTIYNADTQSIEKLNYFKPPVFCMGQHENTEWTIKTWSENQLSQTHHNMTIKWANVKQTFHINPWEKTISKSQKVKMAFMAAYDIDNYSDFVFKSSFLVRYKIKNEILKKIKHNEEELLKLGFDWIKLLVWGINSSVISVN